MRPYEEVIIFPPWEAQPTQWPYKVYTTLHEYCSVEDLSVLQYGLQQFCSWLISVAFTSNSPIKSGAHRSWFFAHSIQTWNCGMIKHKYKTKMVTVFELKEGKPTSRNFFVAFYCFGVFCSGSVQFKTLDKMLGQDMPFSNLYI